MINIIKVELIIRQTQMGECVMTVLPEIPYNGIQSPARTMKGISGKLYISI